MIYIAVHKKTNIPKLDGYIPLQVGAEGKQELGFQRDNEGENISIKNQNFCELTGLYWIWKNSKDTYKGLVHYRRFFGKSNLFNSEKAIYSYKELKEMLKEADIVLPYIEYFIQNTKEEILTLCCTENIFSQLRRCVEKLYPEYIIDFDTYFSQNQTSLFNMMFCKREYFDEYCEWLFSILFELEKYVELTLLNEYQQRLYGFLSERLLNVWIRHKMLKVVRVKVTNIEMPLNERVKLIRRRFTNRVRYVIKIRE